MLNQDTLKSYVNHFSDYADLLEQTDAEGQRKVHGLAKGIKDKVLKNKVKLDLRNGII